MGIPKFYRWLSERYPLLNQPTDVGETPVVDNLYLDMNGIIHNCTHGNDPGTTLTEEEMVVKIFSYLDKLFQVVKPQRLLFMAIDGVAPRAKMNQQRSRRFRSARDAEQSRAEAARKGEAVNHDSFDSNCITPGTPFMARLGAHLRFFVRRKIAEDPAWQRPHVIFSGHDVPGEGEHKIMEHIRHQKRSPDYKPNQRHCLYGLDADLIMLALVSHEPHFCLLREVVSFSGGSRGRPTREVLQNPCQESFILFQIGLLREYLELEFKNDALPFPYDVERVIDDFVLFCMLIGNDFLPALPTLDIAEGALDKLFGIYKQLLPRMGGYLTHAGQLHRGRLEMVLQQLANLELETLEQRAQDAEYMEQKKNERAGRGADAWQPRAQQQELDEADRFQVELDAMTGTDKLEAVAQSEGEGQGASEGPTMMGRRARELMLSGQGDAALQAFKAKYYSEKLGIHKHDATGRRQVAAAFIEGLHWVLEYYYRGVASWTWFFPHHYAPMISDMVDIQEFQVGFELGHPFLPFQQLLGVLPSASFKLLPEPYQWLMTDANSPIHDFYPTDFRVDMEGKRNDWEGVVLIPFIDEARLLSASNTVGQARLSREEAARNRLGDLLIFSHHPESTEDSFCMSTLPHHFATVTHCNSRCVHQPPPPPLPQGQPGFTPQVVHGTRLGPGSPPGYPTLKSLSLTAHLQQAGVEVFGQGSRKESLILKVQDRMSEAMAQGLISAEQVASSILGERCWVRWPYLQEALVQAVSDRTSKADKAHGTVAHDEKGATDWAVSSSQLTRQFLVKHGLDVGCSELVLHVRPCEGLMRQLDGTVEKRFASKEILYPLQASLRRNPAPDPRLDLSSVGSQLGALRFETGQKALFLGRAYYGCVATVLPPLTAGLTRKGSKLPAANSSTMLHIEVAPPPPAAATAQATARRILSGVRVQYLPSGQLARKLHMSSRTLGKITGNLYMQSGEEKVDVGLCVKHGGKGMCVPDYVQAQPDNNGWTYSQALVTVIEQYKARHSWVFTMVDQNPDTNDYPVAQVFPGLDRDYALKKVKEAKAWLQQLPLFKRPLVKSSAQVAPEDAIRALQSALPSNLSKPPAPVELENVKPTLLLTPTERGAVASELAGGAFDLGDRVVCLKGSGSPALGSRGTVVGIHEGALEVLFDSDFVGGGDLQGRCQGRCGLMIAPADLLNLAKPHFSNITGSDAPRQIGRSSQSSWLAAPVQASQTPSGEALTNGSSRGTTNGTAASNGLQPLSSQPADRHPGGQERTPGQARAPPRPKAPQPQGPPDRDARGFTMGRGRTLAQPPVQNPLTPPAPGSVTAPTAASSAGTSAGTSAAHGLTDSTPSASSMVSDQQAASAAAGNLGQQLLAQLQGQAAATPPPPGFDLGKGLLQQLQSRGTAPPDSSNQSSSAQQLPSRGTAPLHSQAASLDSTRQASASHTDAGRAFVQQVQSRGSAPSDSNSQSSTAQSDAGRAFLAQLQRSPQQALNPVQSPAGHNTRGSNPAAVSFEQLLRGAAANQQPRGQSQAQPMAQSAAQPAAQLLSSGAGSASNMTFEQLLKAAAANPTAPLHSQPGPMQMQNAPVQSQPPQPPQGLHQAAAAMPSSSATARPSAATAAASPATARSSSATAMAQHNPGRLFLQQLQQGGLQPNALPQQPSAPVSTDLAGKLLLQQLQRVFVSGASEAATRDSVGAVANTVQPEPSAPLAPTSVLLQNAAAAQYGQTASELDPSSMGRQPPGFQGPPPSPTPGFQGPRGSHPGRRGRAGRGSPQQGPSRGQFQATAPRISPSGPVSRQGQAQQPLPPRAAPNRAGQEPSASAGVTSRSGAATQQVLGAAAMSSQPQQALSGAASGQTAAAAQQATKAIAGQQRPNAETASDSSAAASEPQEAKPASIAKQQPQQQQSTQDALKQQAAKDAFQAELERQQARPSSAGRPTQHQMQQLKLLQRLNAVDASVSLANLPSMSSQFVATVNSNGNMARRLEGSATGIPNPPAASNLDELWAKLQQQHSQEADALRSSRRANSGSLAANDQSNLRSALSAGPAGVSSLTVASTSTVEKQLNESVQSPRPRTGQMSEADFWRDLQK